MIGPDLSEISDSDLAKLSAAMNVLAATGNKIGGDLFHLVEQQVCYRDGETPRRYEITHVEDHTDLDLANMICTLAVIIQAGRDSGLDDDHPLQQFFLWASTILLNEAERRGMMAGARLQ